MDYNPKELLIKFIGDSSIKESDIQKVDEYLYYINNRYYCVDDLNNHIYGNPWYYQNKYHDYDNYRCSVHYYTSHYLGKNGKGTRNLYVGTELVYTWKNRTDYYRKKKTKKQIDQLVSSYMNRMLKDFETSGKPINFDVDMARKLLTYEFTRDYGRKCWDFN